VEPHSLLAARERVLYNSATSYDPEHPTKIAAGTWNDADTFEMQ
jgi:hypothetical protein